MSLYCYDVPSQQAIFVQTPTAIDLTEAAFFYQAQYQHASQLICVPKSEFIALGNAAPNPKNPVIMLHSVGRCGSTLLSQVYHSLPNTVSLSEPDIFSNFLFMRDSNGRDDAHILTLLQATLKLLLKALPQQNPDHWAIKFRSSGFEIADLINQATPAVINLFLYRNITDRTRSAIRAFDLQANASQKLNGSILQRWLKLVPALKKYQRQAKWGRLDKIDLSILAWFSRMEQYLTLHQQNVPIQAVRYEDLIAEPQQVIEALLAYSGFSAALASHTLHVFNKDSQAGSSLGKQAIKDRSAKELSPKQVQQIQHYLKKHPSIKEPAFILPNTLLAPPTP